MGGSQEGFLVEVTFKMRTEGAGAKGGEECSRPGEEQIAVLTRSIYVNLEPNRTLRINLECFRMVLIYTECPWNAMTGQLREE